MLATAIIVFREILEAALIIGIVAAATQGLPRRVLWIIGGVMAGIIGATLVAGAADAIVEMADGMGQEIFNSLILFSAVLMLGWHNVWMAKHGRELAARMRAVGNAVKDGGEPMFALMTVIGIAVLREGSEIVLFLHGLAASGTSWPVMFAGGAAGLVVGAFMGIALYVGLLRVPTRYLFAVTSWMILLLAAGMSAQGAKFLSQGDVLSFWEQPVWDISSVLANDSVMGSLLHTLIGYDARPSGMQVAFYLATILIIGVCMKLVNQPIYALKKIAASTALVLCAILTAPQDVLAGAASRVYTPHVEFGETEIELHGGVYNDHRDDLDGERESKIGIGHGMTTWWFSEVEFEWEREPSASDEGTQYKGFEWVNVFQLSEAGEYPVDLGLFVELKFPDDHHKANKLEIGPMFEKEIGATVNNLNLIFVRDFGKQAEHDTIFEYTAQTKLRGNKAYEFGLQALGETGEVENSTSPGDQEHKIGPMVEGSFALGDKKKFKYNTALFFGVTDDTPDETLRFTVEYEM